MKEAQMLYVGLLVDHERAPVGWPGVEPWDIDHIGDYQRVKTTMDDWEVSPVIARGDVVNKYPISFPSVDHRHDWGVVTHVAFFDSPTGGILLAHKPLTRQKYVTGKDNVTFASGDLPIPGSILKKALEGMSVPKGGKPCPEPS